MRPPARLLPLPLALGLLSMPLATALAAEVEAPEGRELFAREWKANDPRSRAGDGLGPVFNARSCVGCHHQGGPGGAAGLDRNIDIVTVSGDRPLSNFAGGGSYSFSMSFGDAGFHYQIGNGEPARAKAKIPDPLSAIDPAELALIHPGFRAPAAWSCTASPPTSITPSGASASPASAKDSASASPNATRLPSSASA